MTVSVVSARIGATPYRVELEDDAGHRWVADEPESLGGANAGPNPEHLLLGALGACTAVTLTMYAQRKQWSLSGVKVELAFNRRASRGPAPTSAVASNCSANSTIRSASACCRSPTPARSTRC